MSFQGLQATYQRLYTENMAWKLLRADNAPRILAFIADLFAEEGEVPYSRARLLLDAEITRGREQGTWLTETSASAYLNLWIHNGWLRELDDQLTKTDASETALRFCRNLDERIAGTTASHLRIVQEAVRELAAATNQDVEERIQLLESKKARIQHDIDSLRTGVVCELSTVEQRERIHEIYQLASVLTQDFRRVEDEIRQLDKDLRVQIIEGDRSRGDVLLSVMEKETLLFSTEAGNAFESFYHLLCDQNRSMAFREELRNILHLPVAEQLSVHQVQFLNQLMRELDRESDRVFRIRRQTEQSLRSYIESGAATENRAIDRLLTSLEKAAITLRNVNCDLKTETNLQLPIGPMKIASPDSLRLASPHDKLDTRNVEAHTNRREPSHHVLDCLDTVQIQTVASGMRETLKKHGPMTLSTLAKHHPVTSGLEELVAYLRVAKAVKATAVEDTETVTITDKHGTTLHAKIPTYLLSAELFPEQLDELVL